MLNIRYSPRMGLTTPATVSISGKLGEFEAWKVALLDKLQQKFGAEAIRIFANLSFEDAVLFDRGLPISFDATGAHP